jgi:diguanylate cyclase (GGDEF)-like protein
VHEVARWLRRDLHQLLLGGAMVLVLVPIVDMPLDMVGRGALAEAGNTTLMFLLAAGLRRISRVPSLPRPTARFWRSTAWAMACFAVATAVDLGSLLSHLTIGTEDTRLAVELIYPIAAVLTIVAMFEYPSTAQTWLQRVTVGMDVGIVLLGGVAFIWYFSVSRDWRPQLGPGALLAIVIQPALSLVAGFAMLKIAYVGARVISRPALVAYAISTAISIVAGMLPNTGAMAVVVADGTMLSPFVALVGTSLQYRFSATPAPPRPPVASRAGPRPGRRRAFSILPFTASLAAFGLLVIALEPVLSWRSWGVLGAIGALLCLVNGRQYLALRQNNRLLARNDELASRLRQQAWFDDLTGLPNRAHYRERIEQLVGRCVRGETRAALLLVDLDDFKTVNDTLGHGAGDDLLREVASRLVEQVRPGDVVYRLGGDEFVVIAENIDETAAGHLASRLLDTVTAPVHIGEHTATVGMSIGISLTDHDQTDAVELLRTADVAMYKAKAAGKASWHLLPHPAPGGHLTVERSRRIAAVSRSGVLPRRRR